MILLLILACGGEPELPSLQPMRETLDRYELGRRALDEGRHADAAVAFAQARAIGDDPLLKAWQAQALARAGDDVAASELFDEVLKERPAFHVARYNRACVLARLGRMADAAEDIKLALLGGAVSPRGVLRDADLRPFLDDPAFSFLPDEPLSATLTVPSELAWMGSEVTVTLEVVGVDDGPLELRSEGIRGPVELVRVVEDEIVDTLGDRTRRVGWTLRVSGAGLVQVSDLVVVQGELQDQAVAAMWRTGAPDERGAVNNVPLWLPSTVAAGRVGPEVLVDAAGVTVLHPPGSRVEGGGPSRWTATVRRLGQPVVELARVEPAPASLSVRQGRDDPWTWPAAALPAR